MLSFMNSEEITTGGVRATNEIRVQLARESLTTLQTDVVAVELFPDMISLATSRLTPAIRMMSKSPVMQ